MAPALREPERGAVTRRLALASFAALAVALATPAIACPQCAGRSDGGVGAVIALGVMILLPFAIVALAWPAIRRGPAQP